MWDVQSYLMTHTQPTVSAGLRRCTRLSAAWQRATAASHQGGKPEWHQRSRRRMTTRLNTSEVAVLASLPRREVAGLQVTDYVAFGMAGGASGPGDIALGSLMSGGTCTSLWFEILKDSLSKHVFVAGVPGSGRRRHACTCCLNSGGNTGYPGWYWSLYEAEYRALLRSSIGSELRVFTAGDESVAPLRLNPLEVPSGVHVQTHIGGLTTLFKAAFAMEAPCLTCWMTPSTGSTKTVGGTWCRDPSFLWPECQPTLGDFWTHATRRFTTWGTTTSSKEHPSCAQDATFQSHAWGKRTHAEREKVGLDGVSPFSPHRDRVRGDWG